jgi:hypothetical protein
MSAQKFMWVCELSKDEPTKTWKAGDMMEFEDEEDRDFVINTLVLKTAVLGASAAEMERNLVSVRTKTTQDKEIEQPIFSLTLGRNDMVSGLDLILASDHNQDVEFKLVQGTGPVYITCTHLIEMPPADEQQTIMTTSDADLEEDCEDEELAVEDEKNTSLKNGHATKNGKMMNGKNGELHTNGHHEIEVDEK